MNRVLEWVLITCTACLIGIVLFFAGYETRGDHVSADCRDYGVTRLGKQIFECKSKEPK